MRKIVRALLFASLLSAAIASAASPLAAQEKRKVVIDQDCAGPGGTDMQAVLALVNSPDTEVLGITVVTGDAWRNEEVQHVLRLLEIIGRTDIPVVPGATFPLVNSKESTARWEKIYGKIVYQGAWNFGKPVHGPWEIPPLPEGAPTTKPLNEDAAHFLLRMVHQYPHQVTIYEGGPLTNLALAQALDPQFASLAHELVLMGGSINPQIDDPEFRTTPRREFNLWMDPEASHRVLRSPWPHIYVTTVDISVKTRMSKDLIAEIAKGTTPAAQYVAKYATEGYLWDELAAVAWLDPSIISKTSNLFIDVSTDPEASYGDTLVWKPGDEPGLGQQKALVQENLDREKFYKEFVDLMTRPTPGVHPAVTSSAATVANGGSGSAHVADPAVALVNGERGIMQHKRKVILDQDARGPASTDQQSMLAIIQSPTTEVLGITVVSGDQWRDEEVAHTLRMLEIIGRTDIPVVPGAIFPLVNTREDVIRWEGIYGKIPYMGAWNPGYRPDPYAVPPLREGNPTTKPSSEDATQFLIRMLHKYPHEITIYAGGPLTNLALAIALDPELPKLAQELVFMGPSFNPGPSDPEFYASPRRGFNCWWDPEATRMVFRKPWPKITITDEDISLKTAITKEMLEELGKSNSPVAQYVSKYGYAAYMWDELAALAWLDPSIVTKEEVLYMDISLDRGASYGDNLVWMPGANPGLGEQPMHVLEDLDTAKLYKLFMELMTRPTPGAAH